MLRWGYHNFPAIRQWGYHNFADFVNQKKVMISPSDPPHVSSVQKPLWLIFVVREFYYLYYGDWNHPLWFNPFEPARIKSHDGSVCMLYMVTLIISIPQSCQHIYIYTIRLDPSWEWNDRGISNGHCSCLIATFRTQKPRFEVRSLNGCRVADHILSLVPNASRRTVGCLEISWGFHGHGGRPK